ncbi:MAG: hypothetical protein ACRELX_02010, partial [Longimicrobiales bacterium]
VVGARRARITLDGDTVVVRFVRDRLFVEPATSAVTVDGAGETDRLTTLDLLDGVLEVTEAILHGRLQATGEVESLVRIFHAIDILLDASTRVPALQQLSAEYIRDPCRSARPPRSVTRRRGGADPEAEILRRLDLVPSDTASRGLQHWKG